MHLLASSAPSPEPREPIRLVGFLFGGAFLGRPARYTKIIMRFITKLKY